MLGFFVLSALFQHDAQGTHGDKRILVALSQHLNLTLHSLVEVLRGASCIAEALIEGT